MSDTIADATRAQLSAADPANSTWVTANAGSGKTRVLTDRVARLLLNGTPPQRILCLTYTNAAAAHMQNALYARLGAWAMKDDAGLHQALTELGENVSPGDQAALRNARQLFARALETPGGLKIQTIHAFCGSILRQFPLEAGVAPDFQEIDKRTEALLRREVLDHLADGPAFGGLAALLSEARLDQVVKAVEGAHQAFATERSLGDLLVCLEASPDESLAAIWSDTVLPGDDGMLGDYAELLRTGTKTRVALGQRLATLDLSAANETSLDTLCGTFLYGAKGGNKGEQVFAPFSPQYNNHPPNAAMRTAFADRTDALHGLMARLEGARERLMALRSATAAHALQAFARAYLDRLNAARHARGFLDFDALIERVNALLSDPATAQWVLYRLDGGIDHILVDEAQDTSPEQWQVITRLAEEFTAGEGARTVDRTVFVVGDEKQSIYSFQGADPGVFGQVRDRLKAQLAAIDRPLAGVGLAYSFRSSPTILDFVDKVFDEKLGGLAIAGGSQHFAAYPDKPGRVDIWPPVPPAAKQDPPPWNAIVTEPRAGDPDRVLADRIAAFVAAEIAAGRTIATRDGPRAMHEGDVLVLLRSRKPLFFRIIRALKSAGLLVAGADRLKVGEELGVKDILALLQFLATPEDDLSLACVLRSPICGLSERALYRLARGRDGYLWQALRNAGDEFAMARDMLADLRDRSEFLRPFELIERVLVRHRARSRLVGRLGPQCGDALDALLAEALAYEDREAPSLTGFLRWFSSDEGEIRRELETAGRQVRVMTVHGAKGLEAALVVLPDAFRKLDQGKPPVLAECGGAMFLHPRRDDACHALAAVEENRRALALAEEHRGLYVGLTRAESWLVVAGVGDEDMDGTVHSALTEAARHAGAVDCLFEGGAGLRIQHGSFDRGETVAVSETSALDLPGWLSTAAPPATAEPERVNPSGLGGESLVEADDPAADLPAGLSAKDYGTWLHLGLEHAGADAATLAAILAMDGCPSGAASLIADDVAAIAGDPALGWVFGPDSLPEVGITATLPELDRRIIEGAIDRVVLTETAVWAVDFKSNRAVPDGPDTVPEAYLRQLGAYAAALEQAFPGREVRAAILWTRAQQLMEIPYEIVRNALRRATIS